MYPEILVPFLVLLLVIPSYLLWQSRVIPARYDQFFEVCEVSQVRVQRQKRGWEVRVDEGLDPQTLRVRSSNGNIINNYDLVSINGSYLAVETHMPDFRCSFEVEMKDGKKVETVERLLPFYGTRNFRDLGGYETADGRVISWGKVFRSDALNRLVEQDWALLDDLGVRLVCDLRSPKEIEKRPNRLPGEMLSLNIPVYLDNPIRLRTILFSRHRLDQKFQGFYRHTIIDHGAAALGKLLRLAAEPANLPILFHCTAGKDRTGIAAALFLHICQVPRSIILADYSLTNLSIEDFLDYYRRKAMSKRKIPGLKLEQLYPLFSARPQLLEQALTYIEDVYGSVDAYLMGPAGLTVRECMAIRENLTAT